MLAALRCGIETWHFLCYRSGIMNTLHRLLIALGVFALFGICFGTACAGMSSAGDPAEALAEPGGALAFTTLAQAAVPGQSGGEIRQVVRDPETWRRTWANLRGGSSLQAAPPAIDWKTDMVIVVAMPTQSCVSKVTLRSITAETGGLVVDALEEPAGSGCRCFTSQRPFHIVRLARTDAAVRFAVTAKPRAC
jgi:hypothetical protein